MGVRKTKKSLECKKYQHLLWPFAFRQPCVLTEWSQLRARNSQRDLFNWKRWEVGSSMTCLAFALQFRSPPPPLLQRPHHGFHWRLFVVSSKACGRCCSLERNCRWLNGIEGETWHFTETLALMNKVLWHWEIDDECVWLFNYLLPSVVSISRPATQQPTTGQRQRARQIWLVHDEYDHRILSPDQVNTVSCNIGFYVF